MGKNTHTQWEWHGESSNPHRFETMHNAQCTIIIENVWMKEEKKHQT